MSVTPSAKICSLGKHISVVGALAESVNVRSVSPPAIPTDAGSSITSRAASSAVCLFSSLPSHMQTRASRALTAK